MSDYEIDKQNSKEVLKIFMIFFGVIGVILGLGLIIFNLSLW